MFVASANPCPCGYYGDRTHNCVCTPGQIQRYMNKISGPLLDRIDLQIELIPVPFDELRKTTTSEPSSSIREKVMAARKIQEERYKNHPLVHCNAQMTPALMREYCQLDEKALSLLEKAMTKLDLSARAYDRILKVARTIADYEGCADITSTHIAEAISYRNLDRNSWGQG